MKNVFTIYIGDPQSVAAIISPSRTLAKPKSAKKAQMYFIKVKNLQPLSAITIFEDGISLHALEPSFALHRVKWL